MRDIVLLMSNKSKSAVPDIVPDKEYTPAEAAPFLGLSYKQVSRLIDAGHLDGRRMSSMPGSHRVTTGQAILDDLDRNK